MVITLIKTTVIDSYVYITDEVEVEEITGIEYNVISDSSDEIKKLNINSAEDLKFTIEFLNKSKEQMDSTLNILCSFKINIFDDLVGDAKYTTDKIISKLNDMLNNINKPKSQVYKLAERYMAEVIDPNHLMKESDYDATISFLVNYSNWVLKA